MGISMVSRNGSGGENSGSSVQNVGEQSMTVSPTRRRRMGRQQASTSDQNANLQQQRTGFRFMGRRGVKKSKSLPVGANAVETLEEQSPTIETSRLGKKRVRRRLSLDFLRRGSQPIALQRDNNRSKDSKSSRSSETDESHEFLGEEDPIRRNPSMENPLITKTRIVAEVSSPRSPRSLGDSLEDEEPSEPEHHGTFNCATAILRHSYLEHMCGRNTSTSASYDYSEHESLPDDPTVQESIECIFASQLQDGLELWDDEDSPEMLSNETKRPSLIQSPTTLQQSRQNRSDRNSTSLIQSKKRYQQASLVYVGTYDPTIAEEDKVVDDNMGPLPCRCHDSNLPALDPSDWPQAPLLLRPTLDSGTIVKGIRFGDSKEYFWEPESHMSWSEHLARTWGTPYKAKPRFGCCERCAVLPINNGNEEPGKSLVVDFESELFEGSLLLRLRHSEGTTKEPYDDNKGYFKGVNRRYQAVVRGRFKKAIPLTELVTGFQFKRPCGKLPAKWILRGGMKVLSFFAPQLNAKMEGDSPYTLTPLGSTPQSVAVDVEERDMLEDKREEPSNPSLTLLGESSGESTSLQRARARKKAFDRLFVQKEKDTKTDPSKIYTFEFLQHLFNFQDFSIELGSMLGSVELEDILDGQPLQVMASHNGQPLWSFDVWHKCLWEKASQHESSHCLQTIPE